MKRLFLLSIAVISLMTITIVGEAFNVDRVSGKDQVGMVGEEFPKKLKLRLSTERPVPNIAVRFIVSSGSVTLSDHWVNTDTNGIAEVTVTGGNTDEDATVLAYQGHNTILVVYNLKVYKPVSKKFVENSSGSSDVWKQFNGQTGEYASNTPSIVDWSYAGYKQGKESIPDSFSLPYYRVIDYGAIPNDNQSDTQAIKDTIAAVPSSGGIVFFPPGKYDVMMDGDKKKSIRIYGSNIIVKGSGAGGSSKGGTTIKIHNRMNGSWLVFLFRAGSGKSGTEANIIGNVARGSSFLYLADTSILQNYDYVRIKGSNLLGNNWDDHSSMSKSEAHEGWNIQEGIGISETHEIDRIVGNRVDLKSKIMTPLNSSYTVQGRNLSTGIGFEDLHIDGSLTHYEHNTIYDQQAGIMLENSAHSWIRRCRGSNISAGFLVTNSYCSTVYGFIVDGHRGHYPGLALYSTYVFVGLIEDWSVGPNNTRMVHGVSVADKGAGTVFWGIGGSIRGPDCHGQQPRHTLYDNYFSVDHSSASGTGSHQPHHLDGYLRWNNVTEDTSTFNARSNGWYGNFTQAIFVGYKQGGGDNPRNAYVESLSTHVYPDSLYVGQLKKRLGYEPLWIEEIKEDYENFYSQIYSTTQSNIETPPAPPNNIPVFNSGLTTAFEINENTAVNTNIGDPFTATDDDSDDTLTYTIKNTGPFTIDSTTGQISISSLLDYESNNQDPKGIYTLIVQVSDGEGGTSGIVITVNILDVNERPKIILPRYARELNFGIDETNVIGKLIGDPITATDPDADDTLTYSLLSAGGDYSNDYNSFELDSETNQLKNKVALDYEDVDWDRPAVFRHKYIYGMKVRVTDSSGLSDTITIYVTVQNLDEPVFFGSYSRVISVIEGTESGVNIGEPIRAFANGYEEDTDSITYSISGDDADSFDIDSETGQLKTKAALDSDVKDTYSVIVTASDGDLDSSITVTINVTESLLLGRTQQVIDAIMATIQFVDSDVESLTDVTTDHLSTITTMPLKNKSIKSLKSGDFEGLTALIRIELDENNLETLPADIFTGLTSLQILRLQLNTIEELPSDVFVGLSSLKHLYLQSNQLDNLPVDVFAGLTSLTHLGLNDNGFKKLDSDVFDGLTSLEYLFLSDNLLKSLDSELFDGLTSLNTLALSNNNLRKLPDAIFKGLSLNSLRLQRNKVDPIPLDAELEKVEQDQFKLVMRTAAPHDITFPLTVANGIIDGGRTSVHIRRWQN